jgi:DNA-binding CsgD family transcriptional regulator
MKQKTLHLILSSNKNLKKNANFLNYSLKTVKTMQTIYLNLN